ncbi:DUF4139 domain-containing protein [Geoalkalibacter sp.]|uniref:DUF4139 domain-containing protein n=1 Tax=Geoalkalibacter sp. TaxID=3041440 RepID=UPI00272E6F29|nr:DUF4139 domain-containing protein [Geoalkalibacter sp.]
MFKSGLKLFATGFYLVALLAPAWAAPEISTALDDQKEIALTIYNEDLALVKDRRQVRLPAGESRLAVREVSALIRPETALLRTLDGGGPLRVLEQNFDFDLLSPQSLLQKYVGRRVQVVRTHPQSGAESLEEATLLAYNDGVPVLRLGERIETGAPGRLVFPEVPADLRERPTLVLALNGPAAGNRDLELSYLTGGLSWRADYVAELSAKDDRLDLSGWVTLTNQSGTAYRNARLQLVAGDVHRVVEDKRMPAELMMRAAMAAPAPEMAEESLFDYHLYSLARPTTLADRQTKQVALLSAAGVAVRKEYRLRGADYYYAGRHGELGARLPVGVFLEFVNREQDGLGLPLPQGVLRVYKKDSGGNAQFIGEDRIDHTPKNERVRLKLGHAFDITAARTQTDFRRVAGGERQPAVIETAHALRLKNGGKEAVRVRVEEPVPGDWEILKESLPHRKEAASLAVWEVEVPAEGETLLEYRALVRF